MFLDEVVPQGRDDLIDSAVTAQDIFGNRQGAAEGALLDGCELFSNQRFEITGIGLL